LLAVVLVAVVVAVVVFALPESHHDRSVTTATKVCSTGVALTVVADPSIAPAINGIADGWLAGKPVIDRACPSVVVRSVDSASEASILTKGDVTPPDVWIPASSLWVDRVRSQTAGLDSAADSLWLYPPIATSPLVLATTKTHAAAVRAAAAAGWTKLLSGTTAVASANPASDSAGLATVTTAQVLLNGTADTPSRKLVNAFVALTPSAVASGPAGLAALASNPEKTPVVVASEQLARSAAAKSSELTVVYPSGSAVGLDWPVAQFTPPGGDPARRNATVAFVKRLSGATAQQVLRDAGLRGAEGTAVSESPAVHRLATPTVDQQTAATRTWTAAGRTSRTLVVIDLSGSMGASIGGGQTKIEFAAEAELAAIKFFPDSSSLGLWGFSVNRTGSTDWSNLVPLGPLNGKVGNTTRRIALAKAARKMPAITSGDTGLYATTLGAYESVRSGFDPASVNSVVLVTDGANTDTRGINLSGLLSRLRSEHDARRPLPIITIAVGRDADVATLRKISAATGGTTYTAAGPDDIGNAFLDAVIKAG
jgi:Ca-activated chloride channel homolog